MKMKKYNAGKKAQQLERLLAGLEDPTLPQLDLHGLRTAEVADRVAAFIDPHIPRGGHLRIVCGEGSGKLLAQCAAYLTELAERGVIEHFFRDERTASFHIILK
jgi:dsDNA-specific endonuclease/ATPase MutS2